MQCPLSKFACCCLTPKFIFIVQSILGFTLGILSAFWPKRSIGLYQWIMKQFNWQVAPIDEARETRNTAIMGWLLMALSVGILFVAMTHY